MKMYFYSLARRTVRHKQFISPVSTGDLFTRLKKSRMAFSSVIGELQYYITKRSSDVTGVNITSKLAKAGNMRAVAKVTANYFQEGDATNPH